MVHGETEPEAVSEPHPQLLAEAGAANPGNRLSNQLFHRNLDPRRRPRSPSEALNTRVSQTPKSSQPEASQPETECEVLSSSEP